MKKLFWLALLIPALIIGQNLAEHLAYYVSTPEGTNHYALISTGADTSDVFTTTECMTFKFWGADTTIDDSVDIDVTMQTSTWSSSGNWTQAGTYTLNSESTWVAWIATNTGIANDTYYRIILTGSTDNSKSDTMLVKAIFSGYPRKR